MYASSPTSSISTSDSLEKDDMEDEDEEALSFGDEETEGEREMGMQGGRRREGGGYGRKDSLVEKMQRLERARRLLESYGGEVLVR